MDNRTETHKQIFGCGKTIQLSFQSANIQIQLSHREPEGDAHLEIQDVERTGGQMRFLFDDYFLAYTDGKKELTFPLPQPVPISEILAMANIPVWEHYQLTLNSLPVTDLATQVADGDEVMILPE